MTERAKKAAMSAYPGGLGFDEDQNNFDYRELRYAYADGYDQGERNAVYRAGEWWKKRLAGFLGEGLAKNVIEEFVKEMKENHE